MTHAETDTVRERLAGQLAELEARAGNIARDLDQPLDSDLEDQAGEMQDDEALRGQASLVAYEIASIRRAIDRIDDGSYGSCRRCGAVIAPERLAARPEAALCIDCARTEI